MMLYNAINECYILFFQVTQSFSSRERTFPVQKASQTVNLISIIFVRNNLPDNYQTQCDCFPFTGNMI